jgi:ribosomal protein S18 acetylase RimI-like enzyme
LSTRDDKNGEAIRPATRTDLPHIIELHEEAFPGAFMTLLGPRWLHAYYSLILEAPEGLFLVADADSLGIVGFCSGFLDPGQFYTRLRAKRLQMLLTFASRVFLRPQLLPRLLDNYRRTGKAQASQGDGSAELTSLAVSPKARGRGFAKRMVNLFLEQAFQRQATEVVVTTPRDDNDAVNGMYERLDFIRTGSFSQPGREMVEWTFHRPESNPPSAC